LNRDVATPAQAREAFGVNARRAATEAPEQRVKA